MTIAKTKSADAVLTAFQKQTRHKFTRGAPTFRNGYLVYTMTCDYCRKHVTFDTFSETFEVGRNVVATVTGGKVVIILPEIQTICERLKVML